MAHIPDGLLSWPVLAAGTAAAVVMVGAGLRALDERSVPRVALMAAVFFVGALVAVPIGPTSVHLLLSTLMALIIGRAAAAALLVGLSLQAVLFGFGGLTTLGVNTAIIGLPGLLAAALVAPLVRRATPPVAGAVAGAAAALAVAGTGALVAAALALSSPDFVPAARIIIVTYGALMLGEGLVTAATVAFLARVQPGLIGRPVEALP